MRMWSKLRKALYNIVDPDMDFQIQCSVFWTNSSRVTKKGKGREMIPRFWVTIGKDVIWDFPIMFLDEFAPVNTEHNWDKYPKPFTLKDTCFMSKNYTWVSDTIRAYIDTPREQLLTVAFEKDKFGFVDILRAVDRRIGKEKRKPYIESMQGGQAICK